MRRVYLSIALLFLSSLAFSQAGRFSSGGGSPATTIQIGPNNSSQVVAASNAGIAIYAYPGPTTNCATAGTCTLATTFTDQTLGLPCPTNTQVTLDLTNTCVATADSLGNFAFWINPGSYQYCLTYQTKSSCYNIIVSPQTGSGTVNPCAFASSLAYFATASTILSCDNAILTDGAGNLTVKSITINGTGPSYINLSDNVSLVFPGTGVSLASIAGVPTLGENGTNLGAIETASNVNVINGIAGLNGSGVLAFAQLATNPGSCSNSTFLRGDNTCQPVSANVTGTGLFGSTGQAIPLTTTSQFAPLFGFYTTDITTEANTQVAYATTTSISALQVVLGTATGGAQTVSVTLEDNGVATAVTCTVPNASTTCSDVTHSASPVAGHKLDWKIILNSTTLTSNVQIGAQVGTAVQTYSGNTTTALSTTGALTSGNFLKIDVSGNAVDSGVPITSSGAYIVTNGKATANTANPLAAGANKTFIWSFIPTLSLSVSHVGYNIITGDNTADLYDLGIYSLSGTLLCHIGATAGTSFAPGPGNYSPAFLSSCSLVANTPYFAAITGNAIVIRLSGLVAALDLYPVVQPSAGGTTTGGVLNGSITPPGAAIGTATEPTLLFF